MPRTTLNQVEDVSEFDRRLRLIVLEAVERIEVAVRMRTGYILGSSPPFAHEDVTLFDESFTKQHTDSREPQRSKHVQWLERVKVRRDNSDEQFVARFREKHCDRMPVWALTGLLELGQLSTLYRGMRQKDAEGLAATCGVPRKRLMGSWLASLNYVRNVSAHHARLFNRKLQSAPSRPPTGAIPLLDHLQAPDVPKQGFGTPNVLAIIAGRTNQSKAKTNSHRAHQGDIRVHRGGLRSQTKTLIVGLSNTHRFRYRPLEQATSAWN